MYRQEETEQEEEEEEEEDQGAGEDQCHPSAYNKEAASYAVSLNIIIVQTFILHLYSSIKMTHTCMYNIFHIGASVCYYMYKRNRVPHRLT